MSAHDSPPQADEPDASEPAAEPDCKSLLEALNDCLDCARRGDGPPPARAGRMLRAMPRELLGRTSRRARLLLGGLVLAVVALAGAAGYLLRGSWSLEQTLAARQSGSLQALRAVRTLADSLEAEIDSGLAGRPGVWKEASRSVVLVQGAYVFVDPESGKPVRVPEEGAPGAASAVGTPAGGRRPGPGADGPVWTSRFTGTGFVVSDAGHVLTNRHVVRPWTANAAAQALLERGYVPRLRKLFGYLPGRTEPFEMDVVATSEEADLSLVRGPGVAGRVEPLPIGDTAVQPGQPVWVLGYPAGMRALLARSPPSFVDSVRRAGDPGFWRLAERLAAAGRVAPLVTRGIVAQRTEAAVVYDAETGEGGSGGPVLGPRGRVVAVGRAVLQGFGGSNMGVPARAVRRFLRQAGVGAAGGG